MILFCFSTQNSAYSTTYIHSNPLDFFFFYIEYEVYAIFVLQQTRLKRSSMSLNCFHQKEKGNRILSSVKNALPSTHVYSFFRHLQHRASNQIGHTKRMRTCPRTVDMRVTIQPDAPNILPILNGSSQKWMKFM